MAVEVGEAVELALMTVIRTVVVEERVEQVVLAVVEAGVLAVETDELLRFGEIVHSIESVCVMDLVVLLSV